MVFKARIAIVDFPAWIGRARKFRREIGRRLAVQSRIDTIVDPRRLQGNLPSAIASGRRECGPIAGQHCWRWNIRNVVGRRLPNPCALISTEEEQFVLHDRAACRSAELVAFDRVPLCREGIASVEYSVPYKLKQIAMKVVRARLGHKAYRTR